MACADSLRQMSKMTREEGLACVRSCFRWTEFHDTRTSLHQQFVYESAMFAAARGLPWETVARFATLSKNLLPRLKGLRSCEVMCLVREELSAMRPRPSPSHHAALLEHLLQTLLPQLLLYQAAVGGAARVTHLKHALEVECPVAPPPLHQGLEREEWARRQEAELLRAAHDRKRAEVTAARQKSITRVTAALQSSLTQLPRPRHAHINRQALLDLLRAPLRLQAEELMVVVMEELRLMEDLLRIKLSLTSLEKPPAPETPAPQTATPAATPAKPRKKRP